MALSIRTAPQKRSASLTRELARLTWIGVTVFLVAALISHDPKDPSLTTFGTEFSAQTHNWMGRAGAVLSDLLVQLLGMGAVGVCLLCIRKAVKPFVDDSERVAKWVPLFFVLTLSTLAQGMGKGWMPAWYLTNVGGMFGKLACDGLGFVFGPGGARFISLLLFIASLVLLIRWEFSKSAKDVWTWMGSMATKLIAQFRVALQRYRETKRLNSVPEPTTYQKSEPVAPSPIFAPALPAPSPAATAQSLSSLVSEPSEDAVEMQRVFGGTAAKPKRVREKTGDYSLPGVGLLSGRADNKVKSVDKSWFVEKGQILVQKLKDFGVEGEIVNISPGPVITVYEFKPASGVKIKDIANLSDDLTLALSVLSVRIVAPIPGKPVVGIEIPSPHRETVYFKDLIEETQFYESDIKIPIVLGRLASGEPVVAGLATMPHLLVAGSTGTGKSVFINTLISSLLFRYTPEQLRLILVDPKMVELSSYEGIPHLLLPVVVDSKKAAAALRWTVEEMERRYSLMHQTGVRHLDAYNEKLQMMKVNGEEAGELQPLPFIVVVIDEYADLMAVVPKDVELSIARLAQKARASGIHLVLATQRPSTDVVTGTIKANFPSRISFRVASSIDSKTILDRTGAERLLGNGDMLFHSAGFTTLKRLQGAFISDNDLQRAVDHLKAQGEPEYDERIVKFAEEACPVEGDDGDADEGALYDRAVRLVSEKGEASISLIQRHLKIGYNKAASLMEEMEKQGVVGQSTGASKRRAVLVNGI